MRVLVSGGAGYFGSHTVVHLIAAGNDVVVVDTFGAAQQLRSTFHQKDLTEGRSIAEHVLASFPSCPIPEIARLGRTLRKWREPFLAYFATARASNGATEAVNGLIELHRRVSRGFRNRDNCRLRMLLIGGGFTDPGWHDLPPQVPRAIFPCRRALSPRSA